ncbi:SusC/RagA family TonB-linked outer membrane protein, partial [Bacteroides fragilis]|nr:SusC/RagA family TonB-linked outer membrane protein [Bacteroides fragilis]
MKGMTAAQAEIALEDDIDAFAAKPVNGWTNWKRSYSRMAVTKITKSSVQGGTEKTKFYTSLAYAKQEGITARSGLERMTGNANLSHETGRVKVEASTLFSRILQNMTNEGTSLASPYHECFLDCITFHCTL